MQTGNLFTFVGFGEKDAKALAALGQASTDDDLKAIVETFYDTIVAQEDAAATISGPEQFARLRLALNHWLQTLLRGPYDLHYLAKRQVIGRVHVQILLAPRYMALGMGVLRRGLCGLMRKAFAGNSAQLTVTAEAIGKVCDLELAVMLDSYHEAFREATSERERFAAISQLSAGIGHEIKNPLAVIASSAYILKQNPTVAAEARSARHVTRIEDATLQANSIVVALLDFMRTHQPNRSQTDINELVRRCCRQIAWPDHIQLTVELDPALGALHVDRVLIERVVHNLLTNALEAVGISGDHVGISTALGEEEVVIEVDDNGPGFDAETKKHLFEPLFTTKETGIGVGLALVQDIVTHHGGRIVARSKPDGGASFCIWLPRKAT